MKTIGRIGALALVVLAGGCEVTVNNKSVDNQVDAAADRMENVADSAGNALEAAGDEIGNQADALGNRLDKVHVKVDVDHDGDKDGNSQ